MLPLFRPLALALSLACIAGAGLAQTNPPTAASAPRVTIREVTVSGNTLLTPSEVDAITAELRGERTLADLERVASRLQERYRRAGYGAVLAYVPEQTLVDGKARITVLEGRIARVEVLGNKRFSNENIRRSLPLLIEGRTPQVSRIDAQIQLANENPAKQIAVLLEPGAKAGDVDARISVNEADPSRWTLVGDNSGTARTGKLRLGVSYIHSALWDADHQLALQWQTSPSHASDVNIFAGSYRIPLYATSTTLEAFAGYSSVDAGSSNTAAGALSFSGKGRVFGLRASQALARLGEWDQRTGISLDRRDYLNACSISGLPDGACGTAGESVTVGPLTVEYTGQRGGGLAAGFNLAAAHNAVLYREHGRAQSIEAVRPGAKARYSLLRAGGFVAPVLAQDWRLEVRFVSQYSADGLVPGEQFGLAGASAVRGYAEREITGDSGLVGSYELRTPDLLRTEASPARSLRLLAFLDAGRVWNHLGTPCLGSASICSLAAFGVGARLGAGALQFKMDLALALKAGAQTRKNTGAVHFQAAYVLF